MRKPPHPSNVSFLLAVKRTKECEDAIGTSTSEVIDMSGNDVSHCFC